MASLRFNILLASRVVYSIITILFTVAATPERSRGFTWPVLATVFSIFDIIPLVKYDYLNNKSLGKTRSTGGTIVMITSLTLSLLALVSSAFMALRLGDRLFIGGIFLVNVAQLSFNAVTFLFIFTRYLRLFCIPGPRRLPRDYKPFDRASSISEMGQDNGSSNDDPLMALFLEQEKYRQRELSMQDRNQSGPTPQVCNLTTSCLRYDINCSVKSDAGNINDQSNDDILRSRECQIFLRPKVVSLFHCF
jgi:hypothetical protein